MRQVIFSPFGSNSNPYVSRMMQAMFLIDPTIKISALSLRHNIGNIFRANVFWLNWFEDLGSVSKRMAFFILCRKTVYLLLMRCVGAKIIVVIHNKKPHEMSHPILEPWFMRFLIRYSNNVVVLCHESISYINELMKKDYAKKIKVVLHPTYQCNPKQYSLIPPAKFTVLFFGNLRPYKNIELLLEIARKHPQFNFLISGKPINADYKEALLRKKGNMPNVRMEFKFNTDEEIERMMDDASLLVLPYHLETTLNSGVAMYAFSKGLNVVMPEIGTVLELENREKVFAYSYQTEEQHKSELEKALNDAYTLHQNNYSEFVKRAEVVRSEVLSRCSLEAVSKQIKSALGW